MITEQQYEAFDKLKEYAKDLQRVSYEEIYSLLRYGIKKIPLCLAKLKKGAEIDRARKNNGKQLYERIDELGYIKDPAVITNSLNRFGRANRPHQVLFYGALETTHIKQQRYTAIAEISELFRSQGIDCLEGEYYTVSRWKTKQDFFVAEVVFSAYALANNEDIRKAYKNQQQFFIQQGISGDDLDFFMEFLEFISEQFAKKVEDHEEYKISVAYTELAMAHELVHGVSYPSVQTDYFGVNLALSPDIVDRIIIPVACSTQIVYKNAKLSFITNGEHYCDHLEQEKEIEWKITDKAHLSTEAEVKQHLGL